MTFKELKVGDFFITPDIQNAPLMKKTSDTESRSMCNGMIFANESNKPITRIFFLKKHVRYEISNAG
jgi:hypothetical protein